MRRKITLSNYGICDLYYLGSFVPGYEDNTCDFTSGYQFTDLQYHANFYKERERKEPNNKYYNYNKAPIYVATYDNYIIGRGSWQYYTKGRVSPIKISEIISRRYNIPKTLLSYSISRNNILERYIR